MRVIQIHSVEKDHSTADSVLVQLGGVYWGSLQKPESVAAPHKEIPRSTCTQPPCKDVLPQANVYILYSVFGISWRGGGSLRDLVMTP